MKATVWIEKEVEVDVTAEDCMAALASLEEPERLRLAIMGMNSVLGFAKRVPDDVIAAMTDAQREIIRTVMLEQAQRYVTPNDASNRTPCEADGEGDDGCRRSG